MCFNAGRESFLFQTLWNGQVFQITGSFGKEI